MDAQTTQQAQLGLTVMDVIKAADDCMPYLQETLSLGKKLATNCSETPLSQLRAVVLLSCLVEPLMAAHSRLLSWTETTKSENGRTQLKKLSLSSDGWWLCTQTIELIDLCMEVAAAIAAAL